jgi:hypothetical protein
VVVVGHTDCRAPLTAARKRLSKKSSQTLMRRLLRREQTRPAVRRDQAVARRAAIPLKAHNARERAVEAAPRSLAAKRARGHRDSVDGLARSFDFTEGNAGNEESHKLCYPVSGEARWSATQRLTPLLSDCSSNDGTNSLALESRVLLTVKARSNQKLSSFCHERNPD